MKTVAEGSTAPDFELPDQTGTPRRLSTLLADGPVVLFFYPAALSTGCTKEACHFRDLAQEFRAVGAQPIGISADDADKQQRFDATHRLGYPLLADVDGAVATELGVKRKFLTPVKRATFVIGTDRTIRKIISSEMSMTTHADDALAFLRTQAA